MTKVCIHSGNFAGFAAELVERGPQTSKVNVDIFGRMTLVDLPNDVFSASDEAFDPFESFEGQIRLDRRAEVAEHTRDWWLAQDEVTAETWAVHLEREAAGEARVEEETKGLLAQLKAGVSDTADHGEIADYFREHEALFRRARVKWRAWFESASEEEKTRDAERKRRVEWRKREAYRAWWAVQPRDPSSCREFLEELWSGEDYMAMAPGELEAFDRWGREAVQLVFNHYRSEPIAVAELDALPEEHYWHKWSNIDPGQAVRQGFEEVREVLPELVEGLAYAVRTIYVIEREGAFHLLYALDAVEGYGERQRPRLSLVVGGPRQSERDLETIDERLSDYVRSCGWSVPEELRTLYRIHHGLGPLNAFGPQFDNAGAIYPAEQLGVVGEIMNEIAEEQNFEPEGYRFDDLLSFFEDGVGNSENFFRHGPDQPPVGTVDWDHETREVSSVRTFWEFLQESPMRWWLGS